MNKDFRFFDNRQKYLLFVTTTNEKTKLLKKFQHKSRILTKKPA